MLSRKSWFVFGIVMAAAGAIAQTQPAATTAGATPAQSSASAPAAVEGGTPTYVKPETPEQRRARLGTPEDPGPNPDPEKIYYRYGKPYKIVRYERQWAKYDAPEGLVRPFAFTPFVAEIYQHNEKYVWVWLQEPTPDAEQPAPSPKAAAALSHYTAPQLNYLRYIRGDFAEMPVADSPKTVKFQESSDGLPTSGSWRNSMATADMNGDGRLDIVVPPPRGAGGALPVIFLGDGKGGWKVWKEVVWPYEIDYGGVAAGDFNKDGKMDLAFAVHLQGVRVFLNSGNGRFVDASKGLPIADYPTRRVVTQDIDGDGKLDVVALSEGPTMAVNVAADAGKVRGFLNRKNGTEWEAVNLTNPKQLLGGDYFAFGNFNGDRVPDFVGASVYFQGSEILYRSTGKMKWEPVTGDGTIIPYLSYYFGVGTGHFTSKKLDDAIVSYVRFWPADVNPADVPRPPVQNIVGIDRITFTGKEPRRVSLLRYAGTRPIAGLGSGDFDGDGALDIIFTRWEPQREFVLLLGDGKGGFSRAKLEGIKAEDLANYDVTVADVNADGRPDVVVMYESDSQTRLGVQNGTIKVFLNRGTSGVGAGAKKTK